MPNFAPTELSHAHKPASGILSTSQTLAGHADRGPRARDHQRGAGADKGVAQTMAKGSQHSAPHQDRTGDLQVMNLTL